MHYLKLIWLVCFWVPAALAAQKVVVIKVDGSINPATAEYIRHGIERATEENAQCLVVQLNTPGGLLKSTRIIVGDMLASAVPVVVYVAPGGAQAGSAGVFITMAGHVAAMAPGTNIGAAHPVGMQGGSDSVMSGKVTNDAAAFIRTIAQKRNRNMEWAEKAVRESVSITEKEAIEKKVIDLVAGSQADLLRQLDGRQVNTASGPITLQTAGADVVQHEMGWIEKLLAIISDPNVAYILLMIGFYGILFELYNPGTIVPGIVGVISLVLAFYSLHTLPVNYAGLALIVFAVVLFVLEINIVSHGLLAIGGVISLLIGSLILIRTGPSFEMIRISRTLIFSVTGITTLFFLFVIGLGVKALRAKTITGEEGMVGEIGETLGLLNPIGRVRVHGEEWKAEALNGTIAPATKVRIARVENLKIFVEPIYNEPTGV